MSKKDLKKRTTDLMRRLAEGLDQVFNGDERPKKHAFVLLVMPFDAPPGARVNYVSNGVREDIVAMLKEVIEKYEREDKA